VSPGLSGFTADGLACEGFAAFRAAGADRVTDLDFSGAGLVTLVFSFFFTVLAV